MSRWKTISTPKHGSITHYNVDDEVEFMVDDEFSWDGEGICYVPNSDVYVVAVSDTSNGGYIRQPFQNELWAVEMHEDSLWTYKIHHGPSYDWKENIFGQLPNWVKVGGNWGWMDTNK